MKPKVFITYPLDFEGIKPLIKSTSFDVTVSDKKDVLTKAELMDRVAGYDALVTQLSDKVDKAVLDKAGERLKLVANYAVGFDNIDLKQATARKIAVTNTPDASSTAVAEHAMALMLGSAKNFTEAGKFIRANKRVGWDPMRMMGVELSGKKLGIIGCGKIGTIFASNCYHGLGMKIIYHDICKNYDLERSTHAYQTSLQRLLEISDVVSLHVPLLPTTRHLINERALSLMKPSAILINTSRGPVVDEKALIKALKAEKIMAAGLDVFEEEDHPLEGLKELPNAILTPHSASATLEARNRMAEMVTRNIEAFFRNEAPPGLVNQELKHIIEEANDKISD